MKKNIFTLLALLVCAVGSAWADDVVSATQTFTNSRKTCTWDPISATVAKGNTAGNDGLYFTAKSDKAISTSSSTVQGGNGAISVVYVQVVSASSSGTITMTSSSDASDRPMYLESYNAQTNAEAKVVCAKNGSTANFTSSDVVSYAGGYYVKLSNTDNKDVKIKSFAITLTSNESYPEIVKEDPVFSLTKTSITTVQTSQIQVGTKGNLDGIELSGITYGTAGVVTVDADGVVTPVAAGTTTINFSSGASSKYNASTGNSLTITVIQAITVFDAAGLYNHEIILSQANVEDKDYLTCNSTNWADRTSWAAPYNTYFLDMKSGRKITLKVKNASAFELYVSGTKDRTYKIKVGAADAVEYTQSSSTGYVSSGVIATGTTGEVTIEVEGGSNNTLYPVYFIINPAVELTPAKIYTTLTSAYPLDFTDVEGLKAYIVKDDDASDGKITMTQVNKVPAGTGLVLKATTPNAAVSVPVFDGTGADNVADNKMEGSAIETTAIAANAGYILKDGEFHPASAGTLAAGKAYLKIAVANAAPLEIDFDGETTGVNTLNVERGTLNGEVYNLNGQRVAQPTKGLYIVNGRKVVVK